MKNIRVFYLKNFQFLVLGFSIYLYRCVFVMQVVVNAENSNIIFAAVYVYLRKGLFRKTTLIFQYILDTPNARRPFHGPRDGRATEVRMHI